MTWTQELLLAECEVAAIETTPAGLTLRLSAAAVRRRHAGGRQTTGHMTGVKLHLADARLTGAADAGWVGSLRAGHWITSSQRLTALPQAAVLPAPGCLDLTFQRGETFQAQARTLSVEWPDDDTFRESMAC